MWSSFFTYYVDKHIHIALSLTLFYLFQIQSLDLSIDPIYALFLFFSCLTAYNLHDIPRQGVLLESLKSNWLIWFSMTGSILTFFMLRPEIWLLVLPVLLITVLYTFPVLKGRRKLRDLPYIKIFILSFVLTYMVLGVPGLENNLNGFVFSILFISRFIFFFCLCLLFDMRDFEKDISHGLKSLATTLPYSLLQRVGYLSVTGLIAVEIYLANHFIIDLSKMVVMCFTFSAVFLFFFKIHAKPRTTFFSFLCDGLIALPLILDYLLNYTS